MCMCKCVNVSHIILDVKFLFTHLCEICENHICMSLIIHNTALEPSDSDRKQSWVSVFVGLWQGLHSPEYNSASQYSHPTVPSGGQTAECRLTYSMAPLSFYSSFGGQTHSFTQSTRPHSVHEWEEAFIKGKQWIWETIWPAFDRRGEGKLSNKQHTHTHTHTHTLTQMGM